MFSSSFYLMCQREGCLVFPPLFSYVICVTFFWKWLICAAVLQGPDILDFCSLECLFVSGLIFFPVLNCLPLSSEPFFYHFLLTCNLCSCFYPCYQQVFPLTRSAHFHLPSCSVYHSPVVGVPTRCSLSLSLPILPVNSRVVLLKHMPMWARWRPRKQKAGLKKGTRTLQSPSRFQHRRLLCSIAVCRGDEQDGGESGDNYPF